MSVAAIDSLTRSRKAVRRAVQPGGQTIDLAVRFLALPAHPCRLAVPPLQDAEAESPRGLSARALQFEACAMLERPLYPQRLNTSPIPRPHLDALPPSRRESSRETPIVAEQIEVSKPATPAADFDSSQRRVAPAMPVAAPAPPASRRTIRIDSASRAAKPHVTLVERSRSETASEINEIRAAASALAAAIGTARPAVIALLTLSPEPLHTLARGLAAAWPGDRVVLVLAAREAALHGDQPAGWAELMRGERRLDMVQSLQPGDGYLELAPGSAPLVGRASIAETRRALDVACQCGDVVLAAAGDVGDHRARTIAVAARQAVLAVRESTDKHGVREAAEKLRQRGVHLVGVIGVSDE